MPQSQAFWVRKSQKKRPADVLIPGASSSVVTESGPDYVRGLVSILGLRQLELHFVSLCERAKPIGYDGCEVDKQVIALWPSDEPIPPGIVEPVYGHF